MLDFHGWTTLRPKEHMAALLANYTAMNYAALPIGNNNCFSTFEIWRIAEDFGLFSDTRPVGGRQPDFVERGLRRQGLHFVISLRADHCVALDVVAVSSRPTQKNQIMSAATVTSHTLDKSTKETGAARVPSSFFQMSSAFFFFLSLSGNAGI